MISDQTLPNISQQLQQLVHKRSETRYQLEKLQPIYLEMIDHDLKEQKELQIVAKYKRRLQLDQEEKIISFERKK